MSRVSWRSLSLLMAVAGLGVASYLTVAHFQENALVCGLGDCVSVQNSPYAEIAGIPIALLGVGMYLTIVGLGLVRHRRPDLGSTATFLAFGVALASTVYAAYLTYLEVAVIEAICQWCVISALLTIGILVAEGVGVREFFLGEETTDDGAPTLSPPPLPRTHRQDPVGESSVVEPRR